MGADQVIQPEESCAQEPLTLSELAGRLVADAREHHSQRAARTIVSGPSMRATVIALAAGAELAEHEAPPAATLLVIQGNVQLNAGDDAWRLSAGQVIAIPQRRHSLLAETDAAVLLTVALR
jgi:quercetin dioxygenase-like cupin family protein